MPKQYYIIIWKEIKLVSKNVESKCFNKQTSEEVNDALPF